MYRTEQLGTSWCGYALEDVKSKYDVLIAWEVMLELQKAKGETMLARGVVKWLQRPGGRDQSPPLVAAVADSIASGRTIQNIDNRWQLRPNLWTPSLEEPDLFHTSFVSARETTEYLAKFKDTINR